LQLKKKVSLLKSIEEHAKLEVFHSTKVMYLESEFKVDYRNSEGLDVNMSFKCRFCSLCRCFGNGVYQAGRESRFGYGYELFENENVLELAGKAGKTALELLKAKTPKGGKCLWCLTRSWQAYLPMKPGGMLQKPTLCLKVIPFLKTDRRTDRISAY
jgi:TldD protein